MADDFTGALDAAVQLTGYGKRIYVLGTENDISRLEESSGNVIQMPGTNMSSRHLKRFRGSPSGLSKKGYGIYTRKQIRRCAEMSRQS